MGIGASQVNITRGEGGGRGGERGGERGREGERGGESGGGRGEVEGKGKASLRVKRDEIMINCVMY